jgi:hypothetical protein
MFFYTFGIAHFLVVLPADDDNSHEEKLTGPIPIISYFKTEIDVT